MLLCYRTINRSGRRTWEQMVTATGCLLQCKQNGVLMFAIFVFICLHRLRNNVLYDLTSCLGCVAKTSGSSWKALIRLLNVLCWLSVEAAVSSQVSFHKSLVWYESEPLLQLFFDPGPIETRRKRSSLYSKPRPGSETEDYWT